MLKLDPKNTELLAQKQTVLKESIQQTSNKLKELKNAQDSYIKSGGDLNTPQYRNLQREIINTENKLKNLKLEASNWTKASKGLSELSSKMTKIGDTVTNVGKKVSVLSAAIAGLFAAGVKYNADIETTTKAFETFLGTAEDATKAINAIKKQSEISPFDTKELIKANQYLITTGENAEDSRRTISALADAIALTGGGNDELNRMASNLQQIRNAGKATSMDIRQFAYAGIDVYGILAETTGKNVEELKKMDITYEDLSQALIKASSVGGKYYNGQAQMSDTLNGKISRLKKTFQDLLGELSKSLMPIIDKLITKLQRVVDWFKGLDDNQKQVITRIGLFIAALGPVLMIIGKIISFAGTIFSILSKVAGFIGKVTSGVSGLSGVLSVITGPVGIVIGVIGALIAAFKYLWDTNEAFRAKVMEVWASIQELYTSSIQPLIEKIKGFIGGIIQGITTALQQLWAFLEPYVTEICTWLLDFWNNYGREIVSNIVDVISGIIDIIQPIWTSVIQPIISWLSEQLMPVFTTVFSSIVNVVKVAGNYIGEVFKSITGILKGIIDFITGVFSGDWEKAWNGIKDIFRNIVSGFAAIIKAPINAMIGVINGFISGINQIKIPDWVPGLGGKGITISHIPLLAKGGVVDSATLAMIGEGKSPEAVIPLDRTLTKYMAEALKMAGGNRNIVMNFYPQQMTEAELERAFNYVDRRFGILY